MKALHLVRQIVSLRLKSSSRLSLVPIALSLCGTLIFSQTPMEVDSLGSRPTRLETQFLGDIDYECVPGERAYCVGGMYRVHIRLLPNGEKPSTDEYAGVTDWTWPHGLVIEAGRITEATEPFRPSRALRNRLHLEYYVAPHQEIIDRVWRNTGQRPRTLRDLEYFFSFRVPRELANSFLCVNVEWDHPKYGHLTADRIICRRIAAPCSEASQHRVWTTQVMMAEEQKKYELAVALADSFIAMGWHEIHGLLSASGAAKRLGREDDAKRLLDFCKEKNGTTEIQWEE